MRGIEIDLEGRESVDHDDSFHESERLDPKVDTDALKLENVALKPAQNTL